MDKGMYLCTGGIEIPYPSRYPQHLLATIKCGHQMYCLLDVGHMIGGTERIEIILKANLLIAVHL